VHFLERCVEITAQGCRISPKRRSTHPGWVSVLHSADAVGYGFGKARMPRIASAKVKLHHNGETYADRTVVLDEFRSESRVRNLKVHHLGSHHRCTTLSGSESDETLPDGVKLQLIDRCMGSGGYYTVYPRGQGASAGSAPCGYAKVSRWGSPEEAGDWLRNSGTAIPSGVGGDRLYVALPGARQPGGAGPVRVDFAVPQAALIQTGNAEWRVIMQPIQSTPIHNVIITVPNGITLPNDK
jgi:hypothetical protein